MSKPIAGAEDASRQLRVGSCVGATGLVGTELCERLTRRTGEPGLVPRTAMILLARPRSNENCYYRVRSTVGLPIGAGVTLEASAASLPHYCSDCYRVERTSSRAGCFSLWTSRLFMAHANVRSKATIPKIPVIARSRDPIVGVAKTQPFRPRPAIEVLSLGSRQFAFWM